MRPGVGAQGLIPGERTGTFRKHPLEEEMAAHPTLLAWEIPRSEELQRPGHN